ncbi:MAG: DAK2 domain-containing protein, partial [Chloroflexi bacterium]|nr:DAK2 domain-containing protein [Chloroflexota bacterium]
MRATIGMKSRVGRASWFAERTQGVQDPGATAIYLMLKALHEYIAA